MERQHGPAPVPVYCSLISKLLKRQGRGSQALVAAHEVWQALLASKQPLDGVAYRTGMNLYVEMGRIDKARRLMDAMRAAGFRPGWGAYHVLMKYYTERGDMDAARRVFKELRAYRGDQPLEISAYNTLLAGFVRQGDLTMARAVLDKARREGAALDAYTYSCFASGLAAAGRLDEAEALLGEMAAEGLSPSHVVYGAVLDGCARLSDWPRAERLLARLRQDGLQPTLEQYNMILRGRCYNTPFAFASHGPPPPPPATRNGSGGPAPGPSVNGSRGPASPMDYRSVTYANHSSMNGNVSPAPPSSNGAASRVHGAVTAPGPGHGDEAEPGPYDEGDSDVGLGGSSGSPGSPVPASRWRRDAVEALMAEMRAAGIRPDVVTYGTLMDAAVRSGSIDAAMEVLSEMRVEGVPPDAAIYTSLMKLFREQGRQEQALEFFEQMVASRSAGVDAWALSCLVAVHSSMGRMAEAEQAVWRAYQWAAERGRPPPPEAAYALLQGYGQVRQLRPALLAFRRFLAAGGRPHRKMCEFTYRLCLAHYDFAAASQVLRAMRLMRGLQLREELYRQQWQDAQRRMQARRAQPSSGGGGGGGGAGGPGSPGNAAAEKWKWWFGLPNNYYESEWR